MQQPANPLDALRRTVILLFVAAPVFGAQASPESAATVPMQLHSQDGAHGAREDRPAPEMTASVEGINEYRLDNGLRVLLCPDPSRATITVNAVYLVGSRHEVRGEHGMAHLLEHMLTRSTPSHESIVSALENRGANYNATTWFDRTHFFETLSANEENLEFALQLEADRMVQVRMRAEDLAKEMSVVSSEFELVESDPKTVLSNQMRSAAYDWHGYGNPTIGTLSDIRRYPISNLRRFYKQHYQPDTLVLVVTGNFEESLALELIVRFFGAIPRPTREVSEAYTQEPDQIGTRSVTVEGVADVAVVGLMYHVPAGSHTDAAVVQILQDILVGEPSGRLYQAIVTTGMASSVFVDDETSMSAEPGVVSIQAEVRKEQDALKTRERMIEIVEGLAATDIALVEVERAKGRRLKQIRRTLADTQQLAVELTEWIALGDWRMFFLHRDRLRQVTPDDVKRVAREYLNESNRTAGLFAPTTSPSRAAIPSTPDVSQLVKDYRSAQTMETGAAFLPTPENIDQKSLQLRLEPGIEVVSLPKTTRGGLAFAELRFHFGDEEQLREHTEALRLLPALLQRGTTERTYQQLRDEIDRLQSDISIGGGVGAFGVSIESDRGHIVPAIALAAEMLQRPAFDPDQFEILKKERLAELELALSSPQERCFNALRRAVYPWPADSIHYMPTLEERIERINAVSLEEIENLYRSLYGASNSEFSIVGDFDQGAVLVALGAQFGGWQSPSAYERIAMPHLAVSAAPLTIVTPGKPMAVVAMGTHLAMRDDDPDYPALRLAGYVLAGSFRSRLYHRLRFADALSYHVGGALRADSQDRRTSLFVYAFCSPANSDEALSGLRDEVTRWIDDGITEDELAESAHSLAEEFRNRLANDGLVAEELANKLELNRNLSFEANLIKKMETLTPGEVKRALDDHLGDLRFVEIKAGDIE